MRSGCIFVLTAFVILTLWGSTSDSRAGRMSRIVFRVPRFGGFDFRNASDAKFDPENDSGVFSSRRKRQAIRVDPKSLTDYHNMLRRGEGAAAMIELRWSDKVAANAQKWAEKCLFDHPLSYVPYDLTQNLAFGSGTAAFKDLNKDAVDGWFDEKKDFDFATGACRSVCAHYTTMVKWDQVNLGCAFTVCPSLYAFRTYIPEASYLNCEYFSPYGEFPKTPYEKGAACSKCPQKFPQCKEGLCTGSDSVYDEFDPRKIKASSSIHSLNVFTLGGCLLATDRLFLADMFQTL